MIEFNKKIQEQFDKMCATGKLFRSALTGQQVWEIYIKGFTKEQNPIFRDPNSTSHNCNLCNNFIRRYGNIVAVDSNNQIMSIFDVVAEGDYVDVAGKLSVALKNAKISNVFFETFNELNSLNYEKCTKSSKSFKLGLSLNHKRYTKAEAELYGVVKPNEVRTFNHMHLTLPEKFVDKGTKSIDTIMADYREDKNVFQRGMVEIPKDTLVLVKDLINQDSLLDGKTHLYKIEGILPLKEKFDKLSESEKDNWCWVNSYQFKFARFRGEVIGTICADLAEGMELNAACQAWNRKVDPANYMKVKAPVTEAMKKAAIKDFIALGYKESDLERRFATIEDIKASEIKHINIGKAEVKNVSIFDNVKTASTRHKKSEFGKIEEVSIDKFMQDILPSCTSVEAYLDNSHDGNMVSMTTAVFKDSKSIFKWDNSYSWTFNGNLAGKSQIKEAVKSRGGKTEGVLNVRLAFPDTTDDYDLHIYEPKGGHVGYNNVRRAQSSSGMLDLDAQGVDRYQVPEKRVENIIYTNMAKMPDGNYDIKVNNFSCKGFKANFKLEIETAEGVTLLELNKLIADNWVDVATISLHNGVFTLDVSNKMNVLSSETISKEIYGLKTNEFHKVNLVCLSPNHWNDQTIGNKHYFFMLDKCKCDLDIRGIHNENLNSDLIQHRKFMDVLGSANTIKYSDNQLSGLGFNATVKDELIVKLSGSFKRMVKIKF